MIKKENLPELELYVAVKFLLRVAKSRSYTIVTMYLNYIAYDIFIVSNELTLNISR